VKLNWERNLPIVATGATTDTEVPPVAVVTGGGVEKSTFRLGVHNGSWVTDPYNPCGSNPETKKILPTNVYVFVSFNLNLLTYETYEVVHLVIC
jgi:hypothetical protein